MNRKDYRAAFDAIPFREDFQRRTVQMLRQGAERPSQKECFVMYKKRVVLIAACLSALLVVSAAAAALLLSPTEVAQRMGDQTLAQSGESAPETDAPTGDEDGTYCLVPSDDETYDITTTT